jgi:hypothetical protein
MWITPRQVSVMASVRVASKNFIRLSIRNLLRTNNHHLRVIASELPVE